MPSNLKMQKNRCTNGKDFSSEVYNNCSECETRLKEKERLPLLTGNQKLRTKFGFNFSTMFRLKGTVILRIWWQILFMIGYTTTIVCMHKYVPGLHMNFPQTLIPVLGVVTGLLLVFRTNTAYDRYWEGRRIWSQMTICIRTLTRGIWSGVKETNSRDVIEKKSALNLLTAFVFATKHYLREEYSYDHDDMKDLISHLPKFETPSSNVALEAQKPIVKHKFTAHDIATPSNIPIELSYYLSSYISSVNSRGLIEPSLVSSLQSSVITLVDCLTSFERILRTPIPLAYSVHLNHSIWLYLLALPFQMVFQLQWWTIPAVTLASFALLGILGIGWEIENPFGYDDNDLPLDDFCEVTKREIMVVCGNKLPSPDEWIFSEKNHPLLPDCTLNALELEHKSVQTIHDIILKGAEQFMKEGRNSPEVKKRSPSGNASTGGGGGGDRSASKGEDESLAVLLNENP